MSEEEKGAIGTEGIESSGAVPGSEESPTPESSDQNVDLSQYVPNPRFKEVYHKWKEGEREAEELRKENEDLRSRLQAPSSESEKEISYEAYGYDDEKYIDALVKDRLAKEMRAMEEANRRRAEEEKAQAKVREFRDRQADYSAKHPEYEEDVQRNQYVDFPPAVKAALVEVENGVEVHHFLLRNPNEINRLGGLPPWQAAMEIGKMSARVNSSPTPSVTQAPPPIKNVNGGAPLPLDDIRYNPEVSMDDYYKAAMRRGEKK